MFLGLFYAHTHTLMNNLSKKNSVNMFFIQCNDYSPYKVILPLNILKVILEIGIP